MAVTGVRQVLRLEGITKRFGELVANEGIDLELLNWRSVVAPPGLSADQTKALTDTVEKMAKSKEWQEILKARGWDDSFLAGAAFDTFLKGEIERVSKVMTEVGLVK